ncbi:MAG: energy-coupling factor ABC transporter ATP-binding protein, partial [Firmicutes bacterium]|nr:energy-coupling factor ABC transporter ATP-binding protein [Bacillota bacterium]
DKHPYDLSGGEQQMVALAKVLATEPKLLLLDEPTKGIDAHSSERIIDVLKSLRDGGMTIVIVTHDVEFASKAADRCAMFFRGEVTSTGTPREFFSENNFYTTSVNRITRGYYTGCVTLEDAEQAIELQKR